MDQSIQRALGDRVYERRKAGALEVEKLVREHVNTGKWQAIDKVIDQLCNDFAYAVHQPYARNGGLIGLAAASIALGSDVIRYLENIIPPVLACFGDQDARVRYYACESMYNIAKTSKGEILPYFNEIFDALSKLAADTELSVKNGAELLDRLVKDIIADSAVSYVSIIQPKQPLLDANGEETELNAAAFSLARLIPLLSERVQAVNSFTRMFIVDWIQLLDSIPDLELVTYIPSFLYGLFKFLNDPISDVTTATQHVLERFSEEIRHVAEVKVELAEKRKEKEQLKAGSNDSLNGDEVGAASEDAPIAQDEKQGDHGHAVDEHLENAIDDSDHDSVGSDKTQGEWIPGQDVQVDHPKILDILINVLRELPEEHIQLTSLKWIDSFFDICPGDILMFAPQLLNQVLPALSSNVSQVRQAAARVNQSLMEQVLRLPDDESDGQSTVEAPDDAIKDQGDAQKITPSSSKLHLDTGDINASTLKKESAAGSSCCQEMSLDYEGCVTSLTLQFLNEHEDTRVAALSWLIQLQLKAPKRVLAVHDGTFPALLKTLSDPSDVVVTRDLQLLSQIAKRSDDTFFNFFMVNLLKLFCTDRRLLESRGSLIIRQLCTTLSAERIYRVMADCLEKDEDVEFTNTMVEILSNNLITAPELADLRRKLRQWDAKDSQTFFVALYRAWCHNAVATISLCLLAQAYEQTYNIISTFADLEMTSGMLIQLDKLISLIEAPVFTYLRLHLLDPNNHPYLYRSLYGILMLLPQSMAFSLLKNRLNAVSPLGYLSLPQPPRTSSSSTTTSSNTTAGGPAFERSQRLKPPTSGRDEATAPVRWSDLLERFRNTQERARRVRIGGPFAVDPNNKGSLQSPLGSSSVSSSLMPAPGADGSRPVSAGGMRGITLPGKLSGLAQQSGLSHGPGQSQTSQGRQTPVQGANAPPSGAGKETHRSRFSASGIGRSLVHRASGGKGDKEKQAKDKR